MKETPQHLVAPTITKHAENLRTMWMNLYAILYLSNLQMPLQPVKSSTVVFHPESTIKRFLLLNNEEGGKVVSG